MKQHITHLSNLISNLYLVIIRLAALAQLCYNPVTITMFLSHISHHTFSTFPTIFHALSEHSKRKATMYAGKN
jgi:hypothetical protein